MSYYLLNSLESLQDQLYLQDTNKSKRFLHAVDHESLLLKERLSLHEVVEKSSTLFSDGHHLGSVIKTDEVISVDWCLLFDLLTSLKICLQG